MSSAERDTGISHFDFFADRFARENPGLPAGELTSLVQSTGVLYGVWTTTEGLVQPFVVRIQWRPRDYRNFSWEFYEEHEFGVPRRCPAVILDQASAVEDLYPAEARRDRARTWRRGCRERLDHLERAPVVRPGDLVTFDAAIRFDDGARHATLAFEGRSIFRSGSSRYRITRWRERDYTVRAPEQNGDAMDVADALSDI